ncbi:MAG: MFS transporter [Chloroflexi bacterium]|nr:MFS transporter [Chloroflexota bacterium]
MTAQTRIRRRAPARPGLQAGPLVVIASAGGSFATILSQSAFSPFLPTIADALGTTVALLGQAPAASMLLAGILGLAAGPLADRYGQRRALGVGLLALAASAVGVALSQDYLTFMTVMLVSAVGRATVLPVAMAVGGGRFVGDAQRRALSWMSTGAVAATILGVPFLASIGEYIGWRGAFLTLAAIALLAFGLAWRGLGPDLQTATAPFRIRELVTPYRPILRHRPTILFVLASLIGNIGQWNMATYQGAYWVEQHGLSLHQVGLAALAQGVAGLIGSWMMSTPMGRIRPRRILLVNRFLTGLLIAIPFVFPIPTLAAGICLMLASYGSGMGTIASTLALADAPTSRATVMTLNGAAWSVGIALGAASGGLALTVGGWWLLGVSAFGTLGIAAALLLISDQPSSRPAIT